MTFCVGFILALSLASFGDTLVAADDAATVRKTLDDIAVSNSYIEFVVGNFEEKFERLKEEEEEAKFDDEKAAKLEQIQKKKENWRARLDKLETEIAGLKSFDAGERKTDAILKGLSGNILDDVDIDADIIQADIAKMKTFLDNSINDVDKVLTSVKKSAVSRNVKVAGVVLYGGIGSACTFSTDCIIAHSECRHGMCQCHPGLSFDSLRNLCATDCPAYGNTYQFTKNTIIKNFNNLELPETSLAECKQECEREDLDFVCRSMDYFPYWNKCYLSEHTKAEVPDSSWIYNGAGIHLQRDCGYID